ncbi:Kelch repeat-containing protein [Tundrisphaera lichenicola]|uniref:Kelch repeat-containing protein n=1 Tax=Tundrisphaera lichenicola TaxID=2029860 RepID=UPI003EC00B70
MISRAIPRITRTALLALILLLSRSASAHFLWLTTEPSAGPEGGFTIRAFLNETPTPGGPDFLKYVRGVVPNTDGIPLPVIASEESVDAHWSGQLPTRVDAELDLGLKTKAETTYRLYYTARCQNSEITEDAPEERGLLRARVISKGGKRLVQVLFDGKPVESRIKVLPEDGEPTELTSDSLGLAQVDGIEDGKTALWANWVDPKPGEVDGKPFAETRYYASLTFRPEGGTSGISSDRQIESEGARSVSTSFATMPAPAVNSFGGAVLGDWLYVYSGHTGRTHQYSVETTSRKFRRLNLNDRETWEELPMSRDVQGVALVTDGKYLYRVGGMSARNQPGSEHDLFSVADFSRFDPESKTWTDLDPLPDPRSTHDAVVIDRKIYVVGGWTMKGEKEKPTYLDHAVVFDLDAPEHGWKVLKQPFRRRALAAAEVGGKLYVLGGLTDVFKIERRVDVYNPATGEWTVGPDLPGSGDRDGFAASAFSVEGRLYVSVLSGMIARLDHEGGGWEAIGAWSLPRNTHRLLPGPHRSLLAVGGNFQGQQTPVIEAVRLMPDSSSNSPKGE